MKLKNFFKIFAVVLITVLLVLIFSSQNFGAGNCAFSVGGSFSDGLAIESAVTMAQTRYKSMGYNSYYSTAPTSSIVSGYFQNGTRRLESDIVFFAGHGNYRTIMQTTNVGLESENVNGYLQTSSFNWGNTKLVTIMGCSTGAETNKSYVNIAFDIWARSGYKNSTLGWRNTIYDKDMVIWANRYNYMLSQGGNIREAINYANADPGYFSANMKDLAFYGEWATVLNKNRSATSNIDTLSLYDDNTEFIDNNVRSINNNIEFDGNKESIINYMNGKYEDFNSDDFEISIFRLDSTYKNYTIDLKYKINDCYTNQGYVIEVENGSITQITNNMVQNNGMQLFSTINTEISEEQINEKMEDAISALKQRIAEEEIDNLTIIEKNYRKTIDSETGKLKLIIFIDFSLNGGNSIGGSSFEYEI